MRAAPVKVLASRAGFEPGPPAAPGWGRENDLEGLRVPLRADRYSRAVTILKCLLPALGASLLLLVAVWPRLAPLLHSVRMTVAGIDLREARELKMLHPRYAGTDRLNRPYVVTATVGRQLPNRSDLMSLDEPKAVMIVHGGAKITLTAKSAVYQSQPQLLDLFGDVTLSHQNGTRFVTQRAHANLATDTARGEVPIEGHGPSGDVWGQGFRVLDRGDTIVFTGRSHAILRGTQSAKPASPPEPPAKILATAAAVAAAATTAPPAAVTPSSAKTGAAPHHARAAAMPHRAVARPHHSGGHKGPPPRTGRTPSAKAARHAD